MKKSGRINLRGVVLALTSWLTFGAIEAWGANRTWDGGGDGLSWADGINWNNNDPDPLPVLTNDRLFFNTPTALTLTNNTGTNTPIRSITFQGTSDSVNVTGDAIALRGGITNNSTSTQTIGFDVNLTDGNRTINTASGDVIVTGAIGQDGSDRDLRKRGSETLTLSVPGTYDDTTVTDGTLRLTANNTLPSGPGNRLTVSNAETVVDLNGTNQTIGQLRGNAGGVIDNLAAANSRLRIEGTGNHTFRGAIQNTSGEVRVVYDGTGRLTLGGTNTYSGTTRIVSGTLRVGVGATGSISNDSDVTVFGGANLQFNRSNPYTYSGNITGAGRVLTRGTGTLTLSGTNSYTGGTRIQRGTLRPLTAAAVNNGVGGIRLQGSGTVLELVDGIDISGTLRVQNNGNNKTLRLADGASSATYSGQIRLNENSSTRFDVDTNGGQLTLSGRIRGTGFAANEVAIDHRGEGTLILSGNNDFRGDVRLNEANSTLIAASNNALSTRAGTDIRLRATDTTLELTDGISTPTNSRLTVEDPGEQKTLQLAPGATSATFGGNIVITEGTIGNFDVNVETGGELTVGGVISGAGNSGLTKIGDGRLILPSVNTYTGPTIVNEGIVSVTGTGSLDPGSAVTVADGATLEFLQTLPSATISSQLNGSGIFEKNNTNVLTLNSGNNIGFTGDYFVNAGRLIVDSAASMGDPRRVHVEGGATFDATGAVAGGIFDASGVNGSTDTTYSGEGTVELGTGNVFEWNDAVTIAPGNSPGTINIGTALTPVTVNWNGATGGGDYDWEIVDADLSPVPAQGEPIIEPDPNAGLVTTWDLINIFGTLDLTLGGGGTVNVLGMNPGDPLNLWQTPLEPSYFEIIRTTAGILTDGTSSILVTENIPDRGTWSYQIIGNSLFLTFQPVPEPGTWATFAILIAVGLIAARRNKRREMNP